MKKVLNILTRNLLVKLCAALLMVLFFFPFFTVSCHRFQSDTYQISTDYDDYTFTGLDSMRGKLIIPDGAGSDYPALPGSELETSESNIFVGLLLLLPGLMLLAAFILNKWPGLFAAAGLALADFVFLFIYRSGVIQKVQETPSIGTYRLHFNAGYYFSLILNALILIMGIYGVYKYRLSMKPDDPDE